MNPACVLHTARLVLTPIGGKDLPDLLAIKADPAIFAVMHGGVRRDYAQTAEDLANDVVAWGRYGFGIWAIRERNRFVGITGLEHRTDGRGVALRFALWPEAQGRGLAREAAFAALRFGHDRSGLTRIVGVARGKQFRVAYRVGRDRNDPMRDVRPTRQYHDSLREHRTPINFNETPNMPRPTSIHAARLNHPLRVRNATGRC